MKLLGFTLGFIITLAIFWESPKSAEIIIIEKQPMTIKQLDAWAETARFGKLR